jgi:hypothetical protein
MGIMIPPPPPFVPPANNLQGRPELLVAAPQRPTAPQTARAVTAAAKGKDGNKAADPDNKDAEGESAQVQGEAPVTANERSPTDQQGRGGKLSIDI